SGICSSMNVVNCVDRRSRNDNPTIGKGRRSNRRLSSAASMGPLRNREYGASRADGALLECYSVRDASVGHCYPNPSGAAQFALETILSPVLGGVLHIFSNTDVENQHCCFG